MAKETEPKSGEHTDIITFLITISLSKKQIVLKAVREKQFIYDGYLLTLQNIRNYGIQNYEIENVTKIL